MEKEKILEILEKDVINKEMDLLCNEVCVDEHYFFQFLKYSMSEHRSFQCMVRTMAEAMHSAYQITGDPDNLKLANWLIPYINLYADNNKLNFISNFFTELRNEIEMEKQYEYLLLSFKGRFKSFRSFLAKYLYQVLRKKALLQAMSKINQISQLDKLKDIPEETLLSLLEELKEKNDKKNPQKDSVGYRIIINAYNYSSEEPILTNFLYEIAKFIEDFVEKKGLQVVIKKDYIKNAKANNYQSIHYTIDLAGTFVELQLRTAEMHYEAEYGSASYQDYKDNEIQNFLKKFMYTVSNQNKKIILNENLGILKELTLPKSVISKTPNAEIPSTPDELKEFKDMEFLKNCLKEFL